MQELNIFIVRHLELAYAFAIILVLLMIVEFLRQKRSRGEINIAAAVSLMNHQNAVVIDIRTPEQFRAGHIIDALSTPGSDPDALLKKIGKYKNKPIIVACNAGISSQKITALLIKQGYNAYSLAGGMRAWSEADMPVVKESA